VTPTARELIRGVYKLKNKLLLDQTLEADEFLETRTAGAN
jgi:hypothetical protein